jgi:hypothetical protein
VVREALHLGAEIVGVANIRVHVLLGVRIRNVDAGLGVLVHVPDLQILKYTMALQTQRNIINS